MTAFTYFALLLFALNFSASLAVNLRIVAYFGGKSAANVVFTDALQADMSRLALIGSVVVPMPVVIRYAQRICANGHTSTLSF